MRATSRSGCRAHADVRVLTTCARDYVTWRNEFPPGAGRVNGIPVERFPCRTRARPGRLRRPVRACLPGRTRCRTSSTGSTARARPARASMSAASQRHRRRVRLRAALQRALSPRRTTARASPRRRAVLVPTAEREAALGLAIFQPIFRGVRAIMYNSLRGAGTDHDVVVQRRTSLASSSASDRGFRQRSIAERARQTFGLQQPVHHLRRANRRQQGMRGAVRLFSEYADRVQPRRSTSC